MPAPRVLAPATPRSRPSAPARTAVATAVLAGALLAAACFAGCAPAARDAGDVLAVDDLGDTLRLAGPAGRVISLNPVTTEFLFAIGAGDRLVGRTRWDLYPEAARAVADVGDGMQPNVEALLGRRPDLVILYASESNRGAVRQLREAGVQTLALRTDRVADLARIAPLVGRAVGDSARAVLVADTVRAALDAVAALPRPSEPPAVAWRIWDAPLIVIGAGSYMSELLEVAGARNVFADLATPSPQVSLEEVARRDPWALLVGPSGAERVRSDPAWQVVRAVREGRILIVDTTLVGRPGVRMGEAARHLRALILGAYAEPAGSGPAAGTREADRTP